MYLRGRVTEKGRREHPSLLGHSLNAAVAGLGSGAQPAARNSVPVPPGGGSQALAPLFPAPRSAAGSGASAETGHLPRPSFVSPNSAFKGRKPGTC